MLVKETCGDFLYLLMGIKTKTTYLKIRLRFACNVYVMSSKVTTLYVQVCEKEKLLTERNQLKACMGELWENFSCLSQEVCRDVQLSPEQVQSLHHYCPVLRPANSTASNNATNEPKGARSPATTNTTTSIDLTTHSGSATPEPSFHGSPESEPDMAVRNGADKDTDSQDACLYTESGLSTETSNQTVTVDFCQEMTDKCTTDEQPRKDCTK